MKEKFKKFSEAMDAYIETKKFKWFRTLILLLGFTVTGCVCFLAGFFLNRHDNMIYKNNINVLSERLSSADQNSLSAVPPVSEETAVTTEATVTNPPVVTINRELLNTCIYDELELEPYEYYYSNTTRYENKSTVNDFGIPLTKKSFNISYDGVITAGFDISDIKTDTDDEQKIIYITFPEVSIISHDIITDSFELSSVKDSVFNPVTENDYLTACTSQNYRMEKKAAADGLYDEIYSTAEQIIAEHLELKGINESKYTLEFIRPDIFFSL